jgi:hypothetical protein
MIVWSKIIQMFGQMEDIENVKQLNVISMKSKNYYLNFFFIIFPFNRINQKMFVTEDKMVKEMQTLSLELANSNHNIDILPQTPPIEM